MQQQASYFFIWPNLHDPPTSSLPMPSFPACIDTNSLYWLFQHGTVEKRKPVRPYNRYQSSLKMFPVIKIIVASNQSVIMKA